MGLTGINPTRLITEGLQEAPAASAAQEAAASAATFLFLVIPAAAGQAAHKGQALGHAAHGVRHLIDGSSAAFAFLSLLGFPWLLLFPSLG